MTEEYNALLKNKTWKLISLPPNRRSIGYKRVFKVKHNFDGFESRYRASLVAKGFHQKQGLDYNETFSPVVKPMTIWIIISLALAKGWSLGQLYVNNTFLNGVLKEEVYMFQPSRFENTDKSLVCKLEKAFYGLKQASRAWFEKIASTLSNLGFHQSKCDSSLFMRVISSNVTYMLIYVDDILITGSSSSLISDIKILLYKEFAWKDLGELNYFFGIEAVKSPSGNLTLSHQQYIKGLLQKAGMLNTKPTNIPMVQSLKLTSNGSPEFSM